MRLFLIGTVLLGAMATAEAQNASPSKDCQAKVVEPATKPAPASNDGTSPGNAGSTGWSGGLGGSNLGTVPSGSASRGNAQPPVATGLDPMTVSASSC